jgi:4-amino-4-deoxy-L-arabinose transferase-like glycosyltransferase
LTSAAFGLLAIIVSYKVAARLGGNMAGFTAAAFLTLTPVFYGQMFVNPKDTPFAAMFLLAILCLFLAYEALPRPPVRLLVTAGMAIGFALGVRVGGLLLFGLLAILWIGWLGSQMLFEPKSKLSGLHTAVGQLALSFGVIGVAAWVAMLACWPWAQTDPLINPLKAVEFIAHFPWQGTVFFDGETFEQNQVPVTYIPTWFAISLPEFYFVALSVGALLVCRSARHITIDPAQFHMLVKLVVLLVAVCLPIATGMVLRSVVYDGIRQFIFVLPPLAVVAGVAVARFLRSGISRHVKAVVGALLFVSACLTLSDMLQLHPYEYVYFNRLVAGGVQAASKKFETDYWGLSYKEGIDWLIQNYRSDSHRPVRVANCSIPFLTGYYLAQSPDARSRFTEVDSGGDPQIFLATTRFNCQNLITGKLLHVVSRMDTPLLYVFEVHG